MDGLEFPFERGLAPGGEPVEHRRRAAGGTPDPSTGVSAHPPQRASPQTTTADHGLTDGPAAVMAGTLGQSTRESWMLDREMTDRRQRVRQEHLEDGPGKVGVTGQLLADEGLRIPCQVIGHL